MIAKWDFIKIYLKLWLLERAVRSAEKRLEKENDGLEAGWSSRSVHLPQGGYRSDDLPPETSFKNLANFFIMFRIPSRLGLHHRRTFLLNE